VVSICPYSEIHKEEVRIFDSEHFMLPFLFFLMKKSSTRDFIGKVKTLHYHKVKNISARALQWQLQKVLVWVSNISK